MNIYKEFLICQEDFVYFVENYKLLKIHKFHKSLIDVYENNDRVVVLKFRNDDFATITLLYGLWKCMFQENQSFYFAFKKNAEVKKMSKLLDLTIKSFPDWLKPKLRENTHSLKHFTITNSKIFFGKLDNIRRDVVNLVIDEPAFIPNIEKCNLIAKKIFAIGRTNGIKNWFHDIISKEENGFYVFRGNHKEDSVQQEMFVEN